MSRRGITESYGNSIFIYLRNLCTVFHSGCTNYIPAKNVWRFSFSPQASLVWKLFDYGHSDRYELIPHIVLACLSLIISDVEQFFIFLGGIWLSSIEKCLFRSSAHFWLGFCFFEISMRCLYILEINCLIVSLFAKIFSYSVRCLCAFVDGFLCCVKDFKLN